MFVRLIVPYVLCCREARGPEGLRDGEPDVRVADHHLRAGIQRRRRAELRLGGRSRSKKFKLSHLVSFRECYSKRPQFGLSFL